MTTPFRLLVTEPLDGALNMALDEALLLGRLAGTTPPTLRFFSWQPATLSLGFGQALDDRIDVAAAAALGLGLVRRPTGGSAILHEGLELELTYSVAARAGDFEGAGALLETYRWIGAALAAGINRLGAPVEMVPVQPSDPTAMPTFCFARTGSYELEIAGLKVVGSAQRRQGSGFLQHGAVMLGAAPDRLRRVFPAERDPLAGMTTLEAVLGRRPSFEETVTALADGFRAEHGLELTPGGLAPAELELAESLVREKYGTDRWTRSGRAMTVTTPHHPAPQHPAPHPTLSPQGRGFSVPSPPKGERAGEGAGGEGAGGDGDLMTFTREYPDAPRVGVGAVILDGDRVLLVKRGQPPSEGKWSIPGGLVHLGERIEDAVRREVQEECGVRVRLLGLCGVIDRVRLAPGNGSEPRVHYHYVIIDYAAAVEAGVPCAGSDAAEVRWVAIADLDRYDTTDGLADMVRRAVSLGRTQTLS